MNNGSIIFLGLFVTMASSLCGLVLVPQIQFGGQQAVKIEATREIYPSERPGSATQGEISYRANGCIYCHTQQVRPENFGSDIMRNWGQRRTVSLDYLRDRPVKLGTMRTGPDLTNIGLRQPDASWHLLHLHNPQHTSRGSVMPPFRFLFEKRSVGKNPSPNALILTGVETLGAGRELVPTSEALALVAYLRSLKANAPLPEKP